MKHVKIDVYDCPEAWARTLIAIDKEGEIFNVKYGSETTETKKLDVTIHITHPSSRPLISDKAPTDMKYINGYVLEYLWLPRDIKNTSSYTYGGRLREPVDQIQCIIDRLVEEPNDRQCTAVVRIPQDADKTKCHDPPCLSLLDFEIMDNKLNMTAYFRCLDKSNTTFYLENLIPKWGTIEEIEKSYLKNNKIDLLSYDNKYKVFWNNVTKIMRSTTDKKIKIKTETGRTIIVTPNHKFFVFDSDIGIFEKPANELKITDYLLSPKNIPIHKLIDIGDDIGYFLGLWLANGYFNINIKNRVYQIKMAFDVVKKQFIIKWLKDFCNIHKYNFSTYVENGAEIFVIYNKDLINQMKKWGFHNGAITKRVPNIIFESEKTNKYNFYQGWVDGDANCTSSKDLAESMQDLLLFINIGASKYEEKERNILIKNRVINSKISYHVIPFSGQRKFGIPFYNKGRIKNRLPQYYKEKHNELINSDFYFWKIKEIKKYEEIDEMLDIEMATEANLCINGLFVHNSWDAYAGLCSNIPALVIVMEAIVDEINVKTGVDLVVGEMILHSKNCHIYKRQYKAVDEYLDKNKEERKPWIKNDIRGLVI